MATTPTDPKLGRRGGKPRGYKHTGARLVVGDLRPNEAEAEFLRALNKYLPAVAFDQLLKGSAADVPAWASVWRIHAPCVIEEATAIVGTASRWPDAPSDILRSFGYSYRGPQYPAAWRAEYVALNRLPVDAGLLDDVINNSFAPIAADPLREGRRSS